MQDSEGYSSSSKSSEVGDGFEANQKLSSSPPQTSLLHQENVENSGKFQTQSNSCSAMQGSYSGEQLEEVPVEASSIHKLAGQRSSPHIKKSTTIASGPMNKRPTVWGRTPVSITMSSPLMIFFFFFLIGKFLSPMGLEPGTSHKSFMML